MKTTVPIQRVMRRLELIAANIGTDTREQREDRAVLGWAVETIGRLDMNIYSSRRESDEAMIDFDEAEVQLDV